MKATYKQCKPGLTAFLLLLLPLWSQGQSFSQGDFFIQEFKYSAEDASEVFLVWGINDWQPTAETQRLEGTFYSDGKMYTPMEKQDSTFFGRIHIPSGSKVNLMFFITKNGHGAIVDRWDTNRGRGYTFSAKNEGPLSFTYHPLPQKIQPKQQRTLLDFGWILFLLSLGISAAAYFLFKWVQRPFQEPGYYQKVVLCGACLYLFLFLIRLDVIGAGISSLSFSLLSAGAHDLIYVSGLTCIFLLLGLPAKNHAFKTGLFYTFLTLSVLSLLIALVNIRVVEQLGKPFNYRWLYYSDFLRSNEAKNAVTTNTSMLLFGNLLGVSIAFLIFCFTAIRTLSFIPKQLHVKKIVFSSLGVMAILTLVMPSLSDQRDVKRGKLENPVTSFLQSFLFSHSTPALATMDLPGDFQYFKHPVQPVERKVENIENILLIILESAGARYLDLYGGTYGVSPKLNEYADQAAIFEHVYAHAPSSVKSLVSIFNSMYPWVSFRALTEEQPDFIQPSLPGVLKREGFHTSFFTSSDFRFHGALEYIDHLPFDLAENYDDIDCALRFQTDSDLLNYGTGINDTCLVQRFSDYLDAKPEGPFLSILWTNQSHYPYFIDKEEKNYQVDDIYLNRYLNTLHHADQVIGQIIENLQARNLFNSTLIAIVGDHGEAFGQHGEYGHGGNIYEESMQIPFILINPVLFHGERVNTVGGTVDIAPTLLSLTGQKAPEDWQGVNLLNTGREDEVFFFSTWGSYLFGARIGDKKVIFDETNDLVELYDLVQDPGEAKNINADHPELVRDYRKRVAAWMQYQEGFIEDLLARSEWAKAKKLEMGD